MLRFFKNESITGELPKEISHEELDPNYKPPRQIPVLKIIISVLIFGILIATIITGTFLLIKQDKYKEVTDEAKTKIEARVKKYPQPIPNICGEEVNMCGNGTVLDKNEKTCDYQDCPEFASDMTKFWKVNLSPEKYTYTYENIDLKYKFDLLKTWDFIGKDYGFILYSPNYDCGKEVASNESICDGTIIEMLTSNTTAKTDVEEWFLSGENHLIRNSENPPPEEYTFRKLNGNNILITEDNINTTTFYFIYKNNVYILRTSSAGELDQELAEPFIENILNTFEFVDR